MQLFTALAALLFCLQYFGAGVELHVHTDKDQVAPTSWLAAPPEAALVAARQAADFVNLMKKKFPKDLVLPSGLIHTNTSGTDLQLEPFFRKCITPGAKIYVGAVGGSITRSAISFIWPLAKLVQQMCPLAKVEGRNGSRGATSSLLLGMCVRNQVAVELDIMVAEFALNDGSTYFLRPNHGFNSVPYELLVRNVLTAYDPAPALFGISFWGRGFTYETAQEGHGEVLEHYKLMHLSLRDLVWPYYEGAKKPWQSKKEILADAHHPSKSFQYYTAQLLHMYISEQYLAWMDRQGYADMLSSTRGLAKVELPEKPVNSEVLLYDMRKAKMECQMVPERQTTWHGSPPYFQNSRGWEVTDWPPCVHVTDMKNASALFKVELKQGHFMIANCHRWKAVQYAVDKGPAFRLNHVEGANRTALKLVQVLPKCMSLWRVDPLLPPGPQQIEVVPEPKCAKKEKGKCDGFYAIVTM